MKEINGDLSVIPAAKKQPLTPEDLDLDVQEGHLPVVLIDRYYDDTHLSFVTTNNHKGGLMATRHLIGMGHRRIACIQGTITSNPSKERVRGYRDAMIEEGYESDICIVGNEFSIQNGYLETKLLLESDNPPTAIFTLSNTITLGALKAIREASLKIPKDISLLSFDNYSYMDYMEPPITRISQPTEDMGKLATKILFDRIDSVPNNTSQLKLSPSLIAKESVSSIYTYFTLFPDLRAFRFDSWIALRTFSLRAALLMPTVTLSNEPSSPLMNEVPLPCSYSIRS